MLNFRNQPRKVSKLINSLMSFFHNHFLLTAIVWTTYTVAVYALSVWVFTRCNHNSFLHPLVISTLIMLLSLHALSTSVSQYQNATQILTFLLGPATVALAIPLYKQLRLLLRMSWRVLLPIIVAGIVAPLLSWTILYWFNAPLNLQMTLMVKSITTPLAMDTAESIGGIAALAAVVVISTGIVGAVCGPALFTIMGVNNHAAQGTALGAVAHAIGTAKAISISELATAFATLSLCVNGIVSAIILPVLFS